MNRSSWSAQKRGQIRLGEEKPKSNSKPKSVPKSTLEDGILRILAAAAEMQQRQDLDPALQLYQAAMEKIKEDKLDRKRLFTGTKNKPAPLNVRTPIECCILADDVASAICLLGGPNAALMELRSTVTVNQLEKILHAGADVEHRIGPFGRTLLLNEVAEGRLAGVRLALDRGASMKCVDDNWDSALSLALQNGGSKAMIAELLEAGADPNKQDGHGRPLLSVAMASVQPEVLEQMIAAVSPLTADHRDLMEAWTVDQSLLKHWTNRESDVICLLLRHGLDPKLKLAGETSLLAIALLIGTPNVIQLILTRVPPKADKDSMATIIMWAKTQLGRHSTWSERDVSVLKLILDASLDPNVRQDTAPHSPLIMCAANHGDLSLLRKVIALKAEINVADDDGDTPLICAAKRGHRQCYNALKAAGLKDTYLVFGTVWNHYASV